MARDDMAFGINKNWIGKAERLDRRAYLIDLALGMSTCIARIGNEIAHETVRDGQPRWESSRCCFVHKQEPAQKNKPEPLHRFGFRQGEVELKRYRRCPSAWRDSMRLVTCSEVTNA